MRHAFSDINHYPWHREEGKALHTALYSNISRFAQIDIHYKAAAGGTLLPPLPQSQSPYAIWQAVLEGLSAAHKLQNLCDSLLQDQSATSVHAAVQRFLNAPAEPPTRDCKPYLESIEQQTRFLEIPSFIPVNRRVEIEEVFVDLQSRDRISGDVRILSPIDYLNNERPERQMPVILVGRPGSGKTTYLRRVANEHSRLAMRDVESLLPLYCRATELWHHINKHLREFSTDAPASSESGAWIPHFFGRRTCNRNKADVPPSFFEENILDGSCILLLDGVDEVSDLSFYRMVLAVVVSYTHCPMIITTRPRGLRRWNETAGFRTTEIQPLARQQIRAVLKKWSNLLNPNRPDVAQRFVNDTLRTLRTQSDPSVLRMSPGDLTTLIAAWSQKKTFPFSLAKAYEELFTGSLNSVGTSTGIPQVLQDLALDIQRSTNERTSSVPIDWAEERVAQSIGATTLESAREFLLRTEEASGLVVLSDDWMHFWHALFQDFLTARALSRRIEAEQLNILRSLGGRVLHSSWRQPLLFLAEILCYRNPERIKGILALIVSADCDANSFSKPATKLTLLHDISTRITNPEMVTRSDGYELLLKSLMPIVFSERISELDGPLRIDLAKCYSVYQDPRLTVLDWVLIKAGSFYMGVQNRDSNRPRFDGSARRAASPVQLTSLPDFEITRFPITVGQYRPFIDDRGYDRETFWQAGGFGQFRSPSGWKEQCSNPNLPVVGISWYEASAFCMWAGCNLPTEQQWERTAAGLQGRIYPWGDSQPDTRRAAFGSDRPEVAPVGIFPEGRTPDCVFDLAGNAWEWTRDAFAYGTSQAGATDAIGGKKVLRGGSVLTDARFLKCSTRIWAHADDRYSNFGPVGFRCVRPTNRLNRDGAPCQAADK